MHCPGLPPPPAPQTPPCPGPLRTPPAPRGGLRARLGQLRRGRGVPRGPGAALGQGDAGGTRRGPGRAAGLRRPRASPAAPSRRGPPGTGRRGTKKKK